MTSEWNRALQAAQRILQARISSYPQHESGQPGNMVDDSRVAGLRAALSDLKALEEPEKVPDASPLPTWVLQDMAGRLGSQSPLAGFVGLCATCDEAQGRCADRKRSGLGPCCSECTHTKETN